MLERQQQVDMIPVIMMAAPKQRIMAATICGIQGVYGTFLNVINTSHQLNPARGSTAKISQILQTIVAS